ncbi:MAG: radical SAM protein [Deltaproteobacteria bacterium]|nr:MAG: radical SAM protein [Deltaproteobacteria bacterium]
MSRPPRLLLTTVFGPYGIRDEYAEALGMQMELFNNQITREQGVHSPRTNFWTFPLYFLAENLSSVFTTVLDFPTWEDFVRELENEYTHVGISFIQPNVLKAKRMARYIRNHYAQTKIILGGYGTILPDLKKIVPCDEICRGEGVNWLREYFGEDPREPIRHPIMHGVAQKRIYGFRDIIDDSAVIFPGLGCTNGCFFCSTSHKFDNRYIPLLPSGESVFDVCHKAEELLGVDGFAIIDENFLKMPDRARDLLAMMERYRRPYSFAIFSSAETIAEVGVDFLLRLGVCLVWIGVESERCPFSKTGGINVSSLIGELQAKGITVISSSILFLEQHDRVSIEQEIEWAIALGSDLHQFMQLIPFPGTPLYSKYVSEGKMIPDFPYAKLHGQDELAFYHPHFTSKEAREITRRAFRKKYNADGPGVLNMALTAIRGYQRAKEDTKLRERAGLCWNPPALRYERSATYQPDEFMNLRLEKMRERALEFRPLLLSARLFSPNKASRNKASRVATLYNKVFRRPTLRERARSFTLVCLAFIEWSRIQLRRLVSRRDMVRQPSTRRVCYSPCSPTFCEGKSLNSLQPLPTAISGSRSVSQ